MDWTENSILHVLQELIMDIGKFDNATDTLREAVKYLTHAQIHSLYTPDIDDTIYQTYMFHVTLLSNGNRKL